MKKISIFFFIFFCLQIHAQKPEIKVLNKSGCAALTVIVADTTFYVGKTPILWTWVWGDGQQISLTKDTSSHTYYTSGNYNIFMRVCFSNGTCDSVIISGIQVYAKPSVNFAILPKQGCHSQSVCFTNNTVYNCGAKLSYNIDYGDGIIDDSNKTQFFGNTFCHTYLNPGNFHVKIVMKNTCGCYSDTIYLNGVIVKQTPKVNFTAIDTVGCNDNAFPSFINKTIGPANTNFFWFFGDGATSTQTNPSHLYNGPPLNYTVKLVAINPDGNCKDSMVKTAFIRINDLNVDFSMNKTGVCVLNPDTISFFNNTVGFLSCLWDFGDNTFSSAINPKKRYFVAGNMVVKLSVNYVVNGIACIKSITKTIFVHS